jgi:hypothetical protein
VAEVQILATWPPMHPSQVLVLERKEYEAERDGSEKA